MSQHEFHLMHRKLLALGSLAQYSIQRLLNCWSLKGAILDKNDKSDKSEKAAKAVSKAFSQDLDKIKKISNFSKEPSAKRKIFKEPEYDDLKEKIYAELLDTPSVADILLKIKSYPVSYPKNRASINCLGHCSTSSLTIPKCQQPCHLMCGDCVNMKYVCCDSCKLCFNCTLRNLNLKDWHELISKLVDGERIDVCEITVLRLSIILIKMFRNLMSHLTTKECKEIDNGTIKDPRLSSFCKSWSDIESVYHFAIEQVLRYLKREDEDFSNMEMEKHMEYMRNVQIATKHTHLDIYTDKISNYLELERFCLNRVEEIVDRLLTLHSIKIIVKLLFNEPTDEFDLEDSSEYNKCFKNAAESHFGEGMVTSKLEGIENQTAQTDQNCTSFPLTFKIKSDYDLNDYANYNDPNKKAEELWQKLKAELLNKFPTIKSCKLKFWGEGSIIISVTINKAYDEEWSKEEVIEIEENMKKFAEEFEFNGDLCKFNMTFESKRSTFKRELSTSQSLLYQLNAFSEEITAKFDKIDEEKFMTCLQEEMSKVKKKTTVTGM